MRKAVFLSLFVSVLLLMFACAKPADQSTNRETTTATSSPATTTTTTSTSTASADKIGIAECDAFLAAYESCVKDKVPAMAKEQYNTMLAQWRSQWKSLAANPTTRSTLAQACSQAQEQARTAMKTYNCTF
jgi:hypothetical protein